MVTTVPEGLFNPADEDELRQMLASMPLHRWMTVTVTPFTPHPSDPGVGRPADVESQGGGW
ncbi:muconolactone Delta-isomerase family protein [Amycolatopsis mediterranei]